MYIQNKKRRENIYEYGPDSWNIYCKQKQDSKMIINMVVIDAVVAWMAFAEDVFGSSIISFGTV